jgi:threonine dehydrogenase-like Zn-dependent dehydrogenase
LAGCGRLVLVGTGLDFPRLDTGRIILNELVVTGAYNYDEDGFKAALDLIASGSLPLDLLLESDAVGLDGLLEAMVRLRAGEVAGKVLVRPHA